MPLLFPITNLLRNYPTLVPEFLPFLHVYPTLTPLFVQFFSVIPPLCRVYLNFRVYNSPNAVCTSFCAIHFPCLNPSHLSISFVVCPYCTVLVQGSCSISTYQIIRLRKTSTFMFVYNITPGVYPLPRLSPCISLFHLYMPPSCIF